MIDPSFPVNDLPQSPEGDRGGGHCTAAQLEVGGSLKESTRRTSESQQCEFKGMNNAAAMHLKSAVRENRSPERGRHSQPGGFPTTNELFSGEPAGVVIFILASE